MAAVMFRDDTIREMARWAAKRYRLGKLEIVFRDGYRGAGYEHGSGTAYFRRGHAIIELNSRRTISKLIDVLAHELAHCVAAKRYRGYHGHGPKFVKVGNELISRWNSFAKGARNERDSNSSCT